jgi:hypothetical protein
MDGNMNLMNVFAYLEFLEYRFNEEQKPPAGDFWSDA